MKNWMIFFFWLMGSASLAEPPHDYTRIDEHARNTPGRYAQNIEKLAAYLTKPAENDYEKVRSFYVWLSENIAYDVDLFRRYRPGASLEIGPEDVLAKGKAVCQGYADLFNALCDEAGIESRMIPGYSKGFGNRDRQDFSMADHAWNSVKIEGEWYLLDATWGAGGLNEKMQYKAQFNEQYFLTAPQKFIRDHMPLQPMWQLLDCPVSIQAFAAGGASLQQEIAEGTDCIDYREKIRAFDVMAPAERDLRAAEDAYRFNPDNHLVMARGYMDYAHHIMSGIKRQMNSRREIEAAVRAQEEALSYLKNAKTVLSKIRQGAEMEKDFVNKNIKNSEDNLRAMKAVLQN